jgi:type I restriction enzyme S subunit
LYDSNVFFGYENGTTGIKNLDISGIIDREEIVLPDPAMISEFDEVCQSMYRIIYSNGLENEQLSVVRDTLLPRLMSGEIDVSDIAF